MQRSLLLPALLAAAVLGCGGSSGDTSGTSSAASGTSSSSTGSGGGGGGTGGAEPLPVLDPAACGIVPGEGADPALAKAAEEQLSPTFAPPGSGSFVQDKTFFLATLIRADATITAALAGDATLAVLASERDTFLRDAPATCAADVACYANALRWSEADAAIAADAIAARLASQGLLSAFAKDHLRASGRFALHATLDDTALVKTAWLDLVATLGSTFDAEAAAIGGSKLHDVVEGAASAHPAPFAFFEPLLEVALAALAADGRDEAARYEPLAQGENAAAAARIPTIDWSKYPFTLILVPGQGPTSLDVVLDPNGRKRADLAAQRFSAGLAPLVALSGGHVHPDKTPYSEAIEMKKYLRATHGIPEDAILVDPHARHTTTNLRNVTRLLFRHGVPADRAVLVTSDMWQSLYIGYWHGMFGPRCLDELGYLPWRALVPISKTDACMLPVAVSLHADGRDPLDP